MSYVDMVQQTPGVSAYWPLDDPVGSTTARDATGNNNTLTLTGTGSQTNPGQPGFVKLYGQWITPSINFAGGKYLVSPSPGLGALSSGPVGNKTLELWFGEAPNQSGMLLGIGSTSIIDLNNGNFVVATSSANINTGVRAPQDLAGHQVVLTIAPGSTSALWIDGVKAYAFTAASESALTGSQWVIGQSFIGRIQHAAVYAGILSDHRIRQHWRVGLSYEDHEYGVSERLFIPSFNCPQQGSFNVKNGYALYYADLWTYGGIVTADPVYMQQFRSSGYFAESDPGVQGAIQIPLQLPSAFSSVGISLYVPGAVSLFLQTSSSTSADNLITRYGPTPALATATASSSNTLALFAINPVTVSLQGAVASSQAAASMAAATQIPLQNAVSTTTASSTLAAGTGVIPLTSTNAVSNASLQVSWIFVTFGISLDNASGTSGNSITIAIPSRIVLSVPATAGFSLGSMTTTSAHLITLQTSVATSSDFITTIFSYVPVTLQGANSTSNDALQISWMYISPGTTIPLQSALGTSTTTIGIYDIHASPVVLLDPAAAVSTSTIMVVP